MKEEKKPNTLNISGRDSKRLGSNNKKKSAG